ncbi:MAG: cysteine--tRNA ligase [Dehalococcoidia bacterium]|jgi:cysteinyl-tRNA synthetase
MKLYNTLSGKKEEFQPIGGEVKMYVCGVTPYDDAHIGHAMSYVIFDVIRRYLKFRGFKVKYVQNVTDIDDKIIDRANQREIPPAELAKTYADSYFEDMENLNIEPADVYPTATGEIDKIIEVIQGLIDRGFAYPAGGSVYFRVRKDPDYGKLSHRSLDDMMSAECGLGAGEKEDPMDFALWKASKPGEPFWESPWGEGRPGWHIECSAMSLKYLGDQIDIHGGGQDLIFPHHENEIAQSESFTGQKPFVKYWLHNGLVQLGEDKMSKSLGNLVTIKQALSKYSPDAIRVFILNSHYRSPLKYSEEGLEAAEKAADRLRLTVSSEFTGTEPATEMVVEEYRQKFIEAMDDDFNTAKALAILFDLAHDINRVGEARYGVDDAKQMLLELAGVLGLKLQETRTVHKVSVGGGEVKISKRLSARLTVPDAVGTLVDRLVEERLKCRQEKNWQRADEIRKKLTELGVILEDTKEGTDVAYKSVPSEESLNSI